MAWREVILCPMSSITVSTTIDRSPAEVYELLGDLANHEQFTDHFLVDWQMTRSDSGRVVALAPLRRISTQTRQGPPQRTTSRCPTQPQ
jgi:hypothetical protein